ncbi:MAG: DUF4363 family protein [Dehalobacterium sp.]
MAKRIILYGLIVCSIGAIFLFAASTNYFKKPFSHDDNVQLHISNINSMVDKEDWAQAAKELKELETAWDKVVKRVQFTGEEDDIKKIYEALYRLQFMIKIKDLPGVKQELATIEFSWHDIGK